MAMEPPARHSVLLISVILLLVHGINGASAPEEQHAGRFECPSECSCVLIQPPHDHPYEHVKCLNVDDLRGKTLPIHSLDLSNLGLERISNQLEKLKNLTILDLSNNRLSEVGRLGRRIRDLNLSQNRIVSGKLSKIPQFVQKLNLSNNDITVLPLEFKKFDKLMQLELAGNPLNCSCETILVRNWLQSRHVWSDQVIKCTYPLQYKGRPWLQVKQSEVCASDDVEKNIWDEDSDNELMMGDAPAAGSGEKEDELIEKEFMPYGHKEKHEDHTDHSETGHDDVDGSGDDDVEEVTNIHERVAEEVEGSGMPVQLLSRDNVVSEAPEEEEEDEEGSGVPIFVPIVKSDVQHSLGAAPPPQSDIIEEDDKDINSDPIEEPIEESTRVPPTLGIFGKDLPGTVTEAPAKAPEADSEAVAGSEVKPTDLNAKAPEYPSTDTKGRLQDVENAEKSDSKKMYILLAIIVIVMVALIAYVAISQKRKRARNNRRGRQDVENAKETELQDMNKRLIGKPLEKNGNSENAPLMPNRDRSDYAKPVNGNSNNNNGKDALAFNPYQEPKTPNPIDEPLLKQARSQPSEAARPEQNPPSAMDSFRGDDKDKSKDSLYDNEDDDPSNDANNNQFKPITNGYPQPNGGSPVPSPRSESPAEVHKPNKQDEWEKYTPKSPDLKRYSPVYSPETGRVKIKLTETPKPKTPMLVTRSRSNAGQYITTPNLNQRERPTTES